MKTRMTLEHFHTLKLHIVFAQITPGSKAVNGSLAQGDIITAIDGVGTEGMTHLEAQNKIKSATNKLTLSMVK